MIQSRTQFDSNLALAEHNLRVRPDSVVTARAPAKLIISGEHAVVYGQPALAIAINRYTTTSINWHDCEDIRFNIKNLNFQKIQTLENLRKQNQQLQQKFQEFRSGKREINSVLVAEEQLIQFTVTALLEHLNLALPGGINVDVSSNIPVGCGMGSSAAVIMSTLVALGNLLHLQWRIDDYIVFARHIENLQHGQSSGLDLHLAAHGGNVLFKTTIESFRKNINAIKFQVTNTGKPASSTGACVAQAANILHKNSELQTRFANVTNAIEQALCTNNNEDLIANIRQNHALLCEIGVVPLKVQNFIRAIEDNGGAAKICGAGAIMGDAAGTVLIISDTDVAAVANKHGYNLDTVEVEANGTQII